MTKTRAIGRVSGKGISVGAPGAFACRTGRSVRGIRNQIADNRENGLPKYRFLSKVEINRYEHWTMTGEELTHIN